MRQYDDPCGVARALDVVGERWTLLVVRELLFGPKRFSDLVRGLPGMSQNVLSQRLRELASVGLVERRRLGPPVSGQVYELTEHGAALRPVVIELARWGSRIPTVSRADLSVDALALALLTTFQPDGAEDVRITLALGDDRFAAEITGGRLEIVRGRPGTRTRRSAPTRPYCGRWCSAAARWPRRSPQARPRCEATRRRRRTSCPASPGRRRSVPERPRYRSQAE